MLSKTSTKFIRSTTCLIILILLIVPKSNGKPWAQNIGPQTQHPVTELGSTSCPEETKNLCQRCAKHTKSPVVYPWCCTNYEAARDWCVEYLEFGSNS